MLWVMTIFSGFIAALATVVAGNAGYALPLMPICAFYFGAKVGPQRVFPVMIVFAAALDGAFLHDFPGFSFGTSLALCASAWWRGFGDLGSMTSLAGGACLVAMVDMVARTAAKLASAGAPLGVLWFFSRLATTLVLSLILMPLVVWILEQLMPRITVETPQAG